MARFGRRLGFRGRTSAVPSADNSHDVGVVPADRAAFWRAGRREPRKLVREYYRIRRRARALVWPTGVSGGLPFDDGAAYRAFQDWYAARHDDVPEEIGEIVGSIMYQWGPPDHPDEQSFYACSPHRIEMTASAAR